LEKRSHGPVTERSGEAARDSRLSVDDGVLCSLLYNVFSVVVIAVLACFISNGLMTCHVVASCILHGGSVFHSLTPVAVGVIDLQIQVLGRVGAAISSAIGRGWDLRPVCIIVLTSIGTLCITTSLIRSMLLWSRLLFLAVFVFGSFSFDGLVGFSNLGLDAGLFVRAYFPWLVVLLQH
jgi:hypothetical protein